MVAGCEKLARGPARAAELPADTEDKGEVKRENRVIDRGQSHVVSSLTESMEGV